MNKTEIGALGEDAACSYLMENGYRILTRNYRCLYGEIDIVAQIDEILCFVEVKLRVRQDYGRPSEAVTWTKQQRIIKSALSYLTTYQKFDFMCRFDVAEVFPGETAYEVQYIPNAFEYIGRYGY